MIAGHRRQILLSGLFLWLFAVVGTSLVALTDYSSRDAIAANERQVLLRNLHALLPRDELDNDIATDTIRLPPSPLLGTDVERRAVALHHDLAGGTVSIGEGGPVLAIPIINSIHPIIFLARIIMEYQPSRI